MNRARSLMSLPSEPVLEEDDAPGDGQVLPAAKRPRTTDLVEGGVSDLAVVPSQAVSLLNRLFP